ncbi:alpha/beta hydrolase [Amaricoccus sp.]|uniref:alpha/beta hydrolase n=1 Tax=Amaricoccus sp. TaxID=1872485 RepID=UPI0026061699|nr:alpha/beta hydrolase [Amaricoccus sp.]HRO11039.1 alpha/beta hydrolase [Amaricoccus sp.]
MRKILILLVLAAVGIVTFFVYHHPPMRLMPPPLLFQAGGERVFDIAPATEGSEIELFYATSRLPVGARENRIYSVAPDWRLHVGTAELRIGEEETTLEQIREWTTRNTGSDRPFVRLERMNEAATLSDPAEIGPEAQAWLAEIDAALAASRSRDILVYVHGANTTVERAAGQAAMLKHFAGREAVVVLFAWPTAENFLRYARDIRNALGSAPQLADLVRLLAARTQAAKIDVFTISAGATVGSDGLALLARETPEVADRLGEIYHAAPDADFRAFVDDLGAYAPYARRVTAAVNLGDSALRLAQVVNRASRAGRPDIRELSADTSARLLAASAAGEIEIVQVHPDRMPELSATSHTFWYDHPWVSNDVLLTLLFHLPPATRALAPGTAPSGAAYWTFPEDYPARMPAVLEAIRPEIAGERPTLDAGAD